MLEELAIVRETQGWSCELLLRLWSGGAGHRVPRGVRRGRCCGTPATPVAGGRLECLERGHEGGAAGLLLRLWLGVRALGEEDEYGAAYLLLGAVYVTGWGRQ